MGSHACAGVSHTCFRSRHSCSVRTCAVHTDCLTSGLKTDVHTSTSTHTLACMFIGGANIPNM